jgi:hypothetical protein
MVLTALFTRAIMAGTGTAVVAAAGTIPVPSINMPKANIRTTTPTGAKLFTSVGFKRPTPALPNPVAAQTTAKSGRVVQIYINPNGSGGLQPINIPCSNCSAFYVVDSPLPLLIRTDISGQSQYQNMTGESFQGIIGNVQVIGYFGSAEAGGPVTTPFFAKIWVGTSTYVGYIDNRTKVANDSYTIIAPCVGGATALTPFSIAAGANTGYIIQPDGLPPFFINEIVIGNLSSTQVIYLTDQNGILLCPIFPSTVIRLPIPIGVVTDTGGTLYLYNPGAAAVNFTASAIETCESILEEQTS